MADPIGARLMILGWRERLALPALGIARLKAKLDTGARSSSLHVDTLETFRRDGDVWLRFSLHPGRRQPVVHAEARALDRRMVTDTGGRRNERWFLRREVGLAGVAVSVALHPTQPRHE